MVGANLFSKKNITGKMTVTASDDIDEDDEPRGTYGARFLTSALCPRSWIPVH
jgi:hypothetical protein